MAEVNPKTRRLASARQGIALTELAIVLPLLITVTFGIMEYGWMFLKSHQVANAARQGARMGARPNSSVGSVNSAVIAVMTAAGITNTPTNTYFTVTMTPGDPSAMSAGDQFKVRVELNYSSVGLGMPLVPTPPSLSSEVIMAKEGP